VSHRTSDGSADGSPAAAASGALDLSLLRTFLAVHRAGSFTAGARVLGLSQPTVTTQIRALEQQLGRQLFERRARGVTPTAVADDLAVRIAAPLDTLQEVTYRHRPGLGSAPDPVHLAGPAEFLCALALPALAPLVTDGVRLRVSLGLTDDLLAGLRAGHHDLVVSTRRPRGRALSAVPLMDEEFLLVASPAWASRIDLARLRVEGAEGASALRDVPHVSYAEDLPISRRYWRHVFGTRLTGPPALVVPDLRGVRSAVAAGAGLTVLPHYLCQDELAAGTLVALLAPDDPPINTGYLVRRPGTADNPHLTLVHDRLLAAARSW
jgi:DNA-binding transcriptional LysR family regulator